MAGSGFQQLGLPPAGEHPPVVLGQQDPGHGPADPGFCTGNNSNLPAWPLGIHHWSFLGLKQA